MISSLSEGIFEFFFLISHFKHSKWNSAKKNILKYCPMALYQIQCIDFSMFRIKSNFRRVHSFSWFFMHAHWLRNDCTGTSRVYVNSKRKNFNKLFVLFVQKESNFLVALFFFFFFFFLSSLFCRLIEWVRYCNYFFFLIFPVLLKMNHTCILIFKKYIIQQFPFQANASCPQKLRSDINLKPQKLLTKYIAFRAHFKFPLVKPAARQTNSRVRRRSTEICDTARVSWQLKIPCALDIPAQASTWTWWSKSNLKYFLKSQRANSRTTELILGMFVLIWMHISCWIQIWQWKFTILNFVENFCYVMI